MAIPGVEPRRQSPIDAANHIMSFEELRRISHAQWEALDGKLRAELEAVYQAGLADGREAEISKRR